MKGHVLCFRRVFGEYFGVCPVKDDRYEGCFWGSQSDGQYGGVPDEESGGFSAAHGAVQLKPPENILPPPGAGVTGNQANYDPPGTQAVPYGRQASYNPPGTLPVPYGRQQSNTSQGMNAYNTYQTIDSHRGAPSANQWQPNNQNMHPNRYSQSVGVY